MSSRAGKKLRQRRHQQMVEAKAQRRRMRRSTGKAAVAAAASAAFALTTLSLGVPAHADTVNVPQEIGPSASNMVTVGNTVYFVTDDGTHGRELWKSDGTTAGTTMVTDINPGSGDSYPSRLTAVGNTLYFTANDGTAPALWSLEVPDTTPPDTTITSGPADGATVTANTVTFGIAGTVGDTDHLECSLDGAAYRTCTSPATFSGLTTGSHTVSFRAVDAVGNIDLTPVTRTFTVQQADQHSGQPATPTVTGTKANPKKGTLKLTISLPDAGRITATSTHGKLIKKATKTGVAGQTVTLNLKPTRATVKKLKKAHHVKVKVTLTYVTNTGTTTITHQTYTLKRK
jgi:ELWxxDGT repeat protein